MIDRVTTGHHCQEHLRGANIAGRFFAPDVLFAGLQCESEGGAPLGIDGDTHKSARHGALMRVGSREKCRMRPAEAKRHAESLRAADRDIGTPIAGRRQHRQRQQIRCDDQHSARRMEVLRYLSVIVHTSVARGILQQSGVDGRRVQIGKRIANDQFNPQRHRAGLKDRDCLRMAIGGDKEAIARRFADPATHRHCLGCGRCLVKERGICDLHPCQVGDHGLIVQQRLKAALRYLRLIGGIGRVPARIFHHVAQDNRGRDAVIVPHADQRLHWLVLARHTAHFGQHIGLAPARRQGQGGGVENALRHSSADQSVKRIDTDCPQHLCHILVARPDMTRNEVV